MKLPKDRNGEPVTPGARVRLVTLSGTWVEDLPQEERVDVASMIGAVFTVEIDEDGDVGRTVVGRRRWGRPSPFHKVGSTRNGACR